jgi:N-acetylglucosamine kinase
MEETQGMRHVIGLDAGGTKTVGLLADENGEIVRQARSGGANFRVTGELGIEKTLYEVILALDPPVPLGAVCLGIAGADRPPQVAIVRDVIARLGFRRNVRVVNDAAIALVAGTGDGIGVVVVAGTGSIAYGQDASGGTARSGGWGYLLGDEASAFWIGHVCSSDLPAVCQLGAVVLTPIVTLDNLCPTVTRVFVVKGPGSEERVIEDQKHRTRRR